MRCWPLVALLITLAVVACGHPAAVTGVDSVDTVAEPVEDTVPRRSITFVLGSDHSLYNQYYTMASHYYRLDRTDRTEAVVDGLTSLSQVIDYLNRHPDTLRVRPYGLVNLVSHGNEFIDLSATVVPRGARVSAASIRAALADSLLPALDSGIVDERTVVFLHGCAVGQNQPLLDAVALAFGGRAVVKASKLFEYYAYLSPNHNPQSIRHYYARTWYAFYHPDSVAGEESLVAQLRGRYPGEEVDWSAGLRCRFQNNPSELYHYDFIVPCRYTEYYASPDEKPAVNTRARRQQWVDNHADFQGLLDSTRIPRRFFQTKFYRVSATGVDGQRYTGLEVRARAGVICLIQPLVATDTTGVEYMPFRPAADDTAIFAWSKRVEKSVVPPLRLPVLFPEVPFRM